jgi:hypothetical protein
LPDREYKVLGWYLRSEREGTLVTERYRIRGNLPDRPVREEGDRRLQLTPRGEKFLFAEGLM